MSEDDNLPKVEIEIKDYGESISVIVRSEDQNQEATFDFDNECDAEEWIARQKFIVTTTHL